jgi:hypothetical protein
VVVGNCIRLFPPTNANDQRQPGLVWFGLVWLFFDRYTTVSVHEGFKVLAQGPNLGTNYPSMIHWRTVPSTKSGWFRQGVVITIQQAVSLVTYRFANRGLALNDRTCDSALGRALCGHREHRAFPFPLTALVAEQWGAKFGSL